MKRISTTNILLLMFAFLISFCLGIVFRNSWRKGEEERIIFSPSQDLVKFYSRDKLLGLEEVPLMAALSAVESDWKWDANFSKGKAKGIFQITKIAWEEVSDLPYENLVWNEEKSYKVARKYLLRVWEIVGPYSRESLKAKHVLIGYRIGPTRLKRFLIQRKKGEIKWKNSESLIFGGDKDYYERIMNLYEEYVKNPELLREFEEMVKRKF